MTKQKTRKEELQRQGEGWDPTGLKKMRVEQSGRPSPAQHGEDVGVAAFGQRRNHVRHSLTKEARQGDSP